MGKINQGILGGLSGKVGNIIGGSWKGIDYIRIKPSSVANPRTEGQVNQRNKFTATLEFLQPNIEFIRVGYKDYAIKMTAFNAAMSEILGNAITGTAPDFTVDYPNVLVSKGNLKGVLNPSFDAATTGQVTLSWSDNSNEINANNDDRLMTLIYNPLKKESVVKLIGTSRFMAAQMIAIPSNFSGDTIHVYVAFVSADGQIISDSSYVGSGTAA
ncbi:DUF6266 family protein [Lutibacter sp.]